MMKSTQDDTLEDSEACADENGVIIMSNNDDNDDNDHDNSTR